MCAFYFKIIDPGSEGNLIEVVIVDNYILTYAYCYILRNANLILRIVGDYKGRAVISGNVALIKSVG